MNFKSMALAFRIELNFQALNNEGSGGTNVMEPRRISIGDNEYDGISGEIVRRHILENFVRLCEFQNIALHDRCKGLVPDRGKEPLKTWMKNNNQELKKLQPEYYASATSELISKCAVCDVGGYMLAFEKKTDQIEGTLKRDSIFEVGWLITEHPAIVEYTQHSAYAPDPKDNNLFTQNMRCGIYAGVMRIDLRRIGYNDWAWLGNGTQDYYANNNSDRQKREYALLEAIEQWLLSPSGAKQAGWLQHQSDLREGAIVLSTNGPAPFISPIKLSIDGETKKIQQNPNYRDEMKQLAAKKQSVELYTFDNIAELAETMQKVREKIGQKEEKTKETIGNI